MINVWYPLSDMFLDSPADYNYISREVSHLSIDEVEHELFEKVAPVCIGNLFAVTGEWVDFDKMWLEKNILKNEKKKSNVIFKMYLQSKSFVARKLLKESWNELKAQIIKKQKNSETSL